MKVGNGIKKIQECTKLEYAKLQTKHLAKSNQSNKKNENKLYRPDT